MKSISLWQPWASLMCMGLKKNETRGWETKYRGPLVIHAAKKVIPWPSLQVQDAFHRAVAHPRVLPLGALICKVDLYDVVPTGPENMPDYPERNYGDYSPGRFIWKTRHLEVFARPIPFRGRQRIFNVPDDIL
ncbi:MAG: ASCH domain-containing protein [Desulfobacterales bacterium]|nr:ASCH domain-containing protein [Desulfobacterales bacterium]